MSDSGGRPESRLIDRFGRPITSQSKENVGQKAKRSVSELSAMIVGASALVAAIVALVVNFDTLCERFCQSEPDPIPKLEQFLVADYWRMSGAFEVPFFLLEGPRIAKCTDPNETGINRANCVYSDTIGEAWRTELSEAMLVDDGLIDQSSVLTGLRELWLSSNDREVVDAIYCSILEMDGGIELQLYDNRTLSRETLDTYLGEDIYSDRLFTPVSDNPDCTEDHSRRVGYLFYRITNVTGEPITGIRLTYINFTSSGPYGSDHSQNDLILESLRSQNPRNLKEWLKVVADSDLQRVIDNAEKSQSDLPYLLPGKSLLIPVYLFRSNKDGFEDYFYRDWRLPIEVSFNIGNQEFTASTSFPKRDAAAVVRVFNGWYQQ